MGLGNYEWRLPHPPLTLSSSTSAPIWASVPEVWSRRHLHREAGKVDNTVGNQEEHGDNRSYGVQLPNKQGELGMYTENITQ